MEHVTVLQKHYKNRTEIIFRLLLFITINSDYPDFLYHVNFNVQILHLKKKQLKLRCFKIINMQN